MKPGQKLTVMAQGLSRDGNGVATVDGVQVYVPGLLPGETGEVKIAHVSRRRPRAHASLVERRTSAPGRRKPPCRHHGQCSGCPLMDLSFAGQIEALEAQVRGTWDLPIDRLVALPEQDLGYRHSSKRVFAGHPGAVILGSHIRGSHVVADMSGCLVDHPDIAKAADQIAQIATELGGFPYDEETQEGDLRYAWLKTDGQGHVIVAIITADPLHTAAVDIANRLEGVAGVAWGVNSSLGNDMRGSSLRPLRGQQSIEINFGQTTTHVGPQGFLQPNPAVAKIAYHDLVRVPAGGSLHGRLALDLYAGAGVTTTLLERQFDQVIPCESFPESAHRLGVEPELVEAFLTRFIGETRSPQIPDLVLANPPRGGLGVTVCQQLNELRAPRLHLMSCSPASLVEDLHHLTGPDGHYRVIGARAYATLPQTTHLELVVWLVGTAQHP